jgi:hypothetical protein
MVTCSHTRIHTHPHKTFTHAHDARTHTHAHRTTARTHLYTHVHIYKHTPNGRLWLHYGRWLQHTEQPALQGRQGPPSQAASQGANHTDLCVCLYVCMCVCVYVCMCVCVCVRLYEACTSVHDMPQHTISLPQHCKPACNMCVQFCKIHADSTFYICVRHRRMCCQITTATPSSRRRLHIKTLCCRLHSWSAFVCTTRLCVCVIVCLCVCLCP